MSLSTSRVDVYADRASARINRNVYGHFAEHLGRCIDEGIWVGEGSSIPNTGGIRNDVVAALERIRPPVVRWPGGCFADDYHWADGVGPRDRRPRTVNVHWGGVVETNAFGTHEFIRFCRLIGAAPYVCGNVGSGSPRELRDWVEYCNASVDSTLVRRRADNGSPEPLGVRYWGVGNESWGCGGSMDAEDYAVHCRRFATFLPTFGDTPITRIACGPSGNDADWTHRFFDKLGARLHLIQGYAAHLYQPALGEDVRFDQAQHDAVVMKHLEMERLVCQQRAIMDGYDPERRIGLIVDEWGVWHRNATRHFLYQQNTMRDAVTAAAILDVFNRHADKVVMANIAQTINVLQSMILTDGARMLTTPTYHVYDLYQVHQDAASVPIEVDGPRQSVGEAIAVANDAPLVVGSASVSDTHLHLSLVSLHYDQDAPCRVVVHGVATASATARVLAGDTPQAHNTFDQPDRVQPIALTVAGEGRTWEVDLPPCAVAVIELPLTG